MIGVYNHLLRKVFRFHYHSQKVNGSLGHSTSYTFITWEMSLPRFHASCLLLTWIQRLRRRGRWRQLLPSHRGAPALRDTVCGGKKAQDEDACLSSCCLVLWWNKKNGIFIHFIHNLVGGETTLIEKYDRQIGSSLQDSQKCLSCHQPAIVWI